MPLEAESMFQQLGSLRLPVRASAIGETGLASLDPIRDRLLELFASAINSELTEAWTVVLDRLGGPRAKLGVLPVSDKFPDEPTEAHLTQRQTGFPLLALHRTGVGVYEQTTIEITRLVQPWSLHYILGPLDVIDGRQLKDMCVAVAKIVALVIRKRGHESFQGGALQFFGEASPDGVSPISNLRIVSHEGPGQATFGGNDSTTVYWAIEIRLESVELSAYDEDAEGSEFEGGGITVNVGGGEGLTPSLIIAKTDSDPNA